MNPHGRERSLHLPLHLSAGVWLFLGDYDRRWHETRHVFLYIPACLFFSAPPVLILEARPEHYYREIYTLEDTYTEPGRTFPLTTPFLLQFREFGALAQSEFLCLVEFTSRPARSHRNHYLEPVIHWSRSWRGQACFSRMGTATGITPGSVLVLCRLECAGAVSRGSRVVFLLRPPP
jgi:hypothetical protein